MGNLDEFKPQPPYGLIDQHILLLLINLSIYGAVYVAHIGLSLIEANAK